MLRQPAALAYPVNLRDMHQDEFSALTEPYRRELQAHCYRLSGSMQEAEDLVQETLLRAWRRRETYAGRAPLRAWLYKIATNLCLDALKQRPRRTLPMTRQTASTLDSPLGAAPREPIWLEPFPDDLLAPEDDNPEARFSIRESVTLAFMTCLHLLPPRQRAVLILRDVLDWRTREVADLFGLSVPAVKSLLHRARTTLDDHQRAAGANAMSVQTLDDRLRRQLKRYVHAWESADVNKLLALLTAEATFSMPPTPEWYRGRDNIRGLIGMTIFSGQAQGRWRLQPTRANGRSAFGIYQRDESTGLYEAHGIQVVTFDGEHIADIITFKDSALMRYFNLPMCLHAE